MLSGLLIQLKHFVLYAIVDGFWVWYATYDLTNYVTLKD